MSRPATSVAPAESDEPTSSAEPTGFLDDFGAVDPTQKGYRDPMVQVWEPGVFPGFGLTSDYDIVRRILASGPRHAARVDRAGTNFNPLLPTVSCGAPSHEGKRCGRGVSAVFARAKGFSYVGVDCTRDTPPHRTTFYATGQEAIVEIIAAAYDPVGTETLIKNLAVRARTLRDQVREVNDQLAILEEELGGLATNESMAAVRRDEDDIAFWRERRLPLLAKRRTLRATRAGLDERLQGLEDPSQLDRQVRIAARLATDLPSLFARSKEFPGRTRELISLLVRSMAIRQMTSGLMLFELELPTGQVTHHLIITDNFRCSQAERLFAYSSLQRGADPAVVATQLGTERKFSGAARRASADTICSFALLHAYFECVEPRDGQHETVGQLTRALRLTEDAVWNAGLEGRLGPARLTAAGELAFCPTANERLWLSPWVGQCEVAAQLRIAPEALVSSFSLSESTGMGSHALLRVGVKPQHGGTDAAGRRFFLREKLPKTMLAALDSYTPDARVQRLREATMLELARADYDPAQVDSWHRQHVVRGELRSRLGFTSVQTLTRAARAKHIDQVLCRVTDPGRGGHSLTCFIFMPPDLLYRGTLVKVQAWLKGLGPRAIQTGDGRLRRVNHRGKGGRAGAKSRSEG